MNCIGKGISCVKMGLNCLVNGMSCLGMEFIGLRIGVNYFGTE